MTDDIKISIIIPIYNKELLLERCLRSIQMQTYANIEVIMINDGSTDKSEDICLSFAKDDARFKYYFQKNSGVSAARNYGLSVKSGDYYTFVDSDDWIESEYCQTMLDTALTGESDMVFCGMNYYVDGKKTRQIEEGMADVVSNRRIQHFLIGHSQHVLGSCWRILYESSKFQGIKFNEKLHIYEDLIYMLTCFYHAKNTSNIDSAMYNYDLPETGYFKKYYCDNIIEVCYSVGKILYGILMDFGYADWAKAELFKEYSLAINWICSVECDRKRLLKELRKHNLALEFCVKENYKAYKKLYGANSTSAKLTLWLQSKKYNLFYNRCRIIKGKLSGR